MGSFRTRVPRFAGSSPWRNPESAAVVPVSVVYRVGGRPGLLRGLLHGLSGLPLARNWLWYEATPNGDSFPGAGAFGKGAGFGGPPERGERSSVQFAALDGNSGRRMIQKCPHCHRDVIFSRDICPACGHSSTEEERSEITDLERDRREIGRAHV